MASFTTPNPYVMALRNLERERGIPEAMAQQSMQPMQGQMVSGHYVAPSWTQGLSKLAQAYMAKKGMGRIDQEMQDTVSSRNKALAAALKEPEPISEYIRNPDYVAPPLSERIGAVDPDLGWQIALSEREREQKLSDAKELIDYRGNTGMDRPSSVAEYEYRLTLPGGIGGEADKAFLQGKRGPDFLNLGGGYRGVGLASEGEYYPVTPKPEAMPDFKAAQTTAVENARAGAERQAGQRQAASTVSAKGSQVEMLNDEIDSAIDDADAWTTGIGSVLTGWIPGTPAADLSENLKTIKANIGFDKLQEMRDNSPTGGALGQVSEKENELLQSVWGALAQSQSRKQFVENLKKVKRQVNESWARIYRAYEQDYGVPHPEAPNAQKGGNPSVPSNNYQISRDQSKPQNGPLKWDDL